MEAMLRGSSADTERSFKMLYPSIDELKKRADSRYTLVMIASKRSRDLIDGYPALVDIGNDKPVSIATEEIAEDMISYTRMKKTNADSSLTENGLSSEEETIIDPDSGQDDSGIESIYPEIRSIDDKETEEDETEILQEEDLTVEPSSNEEPGEQDSTEEPDGIADYEES